LGIAEFMEIDNLKDKLKLMDVLEMEEELDSEIEDDPENISANKE